MTSVSSKRNSSKYFSNIESIRKPLQSIRQNLHGVFLGGACNPTAWRKDIAVPFLEANGISYFNPQVDEWYPELMALEAEAKEQASCLLFVFQPNLTRGLSSLVEVAYLAAQLYSHLHPPRPLLIVRPSNLSVAFDTGSCCSSLEMASVEAAYQWLEGLRLPYVLFFNELEEALDYVKAFYLRKHTKDQVVTRRRKLRKECSLDVPYERMLQAYQYSSPPRGGAANMKVDLYCGGDLPKFNIMDEQLRWIMPMANIQRDLMLTLAVQHNCSRCYFHISRHDFWMVEQMEAAFAIGCGKYVILCVEYLSDDESSQSSGFSSLASTPEEVYQRSESSSASSASSSISNSEEFDEDTLLHSLTIQPTKALLKASDFTPSIIKDHNRSRSYLKSLLVDGRGILLSHPVENIKDMLLYIQ